MRLPVASSASLEPARQRQVWIDDRPSTELGLRSRSHFFRMIFAPEAADASGVNLVYGRCAKEGGSRNWKPSRGMLAILRLGFVCADRGGQAMWSRPFGATLHSGSIKQLGGASEDARSYWQGRFAACALLTFPLEWSPAERLGRCPKPHQRRCLWTPQGAIAP